MYQDIKVIEGTGFNAEQSGTVNYLTKANYRLSIPNCPILSQTATKCSIPKINTGSATQMTPQLSIPHVGDSLLSSPLVVSFPVLSDMSNYMEVYEWMNRMLSDDLSNARSAAAARHYGIGKTTNVSHSELSLDQFYVDSSIILYDRNNNPSLNISFLGMIPTDLSSIDLDALTVSQDPIYAQVTFKYIMYKITTIEK